MIQYYKEIDGEKVFFKNPLIMDDRQVINPTEEQLTECGWIKYVPEVYTPTPIQLLEQARQEKLMEIESYDNSQEVNECLIHYQGETIPYWADKTTRTTLKEAVRDCIAVGLDKYRLDLREYGVSMEIDCELMLGMLQELEVYAIRCYNKTTDHIYAVKAMDNIEDIQAYDYQSDYPSKLEFSI
jgi:hypothetical protein